MSNDYDADATMRLRDESLKLAHEKIKSLTNERDLYREQSRKSGNDAERFFRKTEELEKKLVQQQEVALEKNLKTIELSNSRIVELENLLKAEKIHSEFLNNKLEQKLAIYGMPMFDLYDFERMVIRRTEAPNGYDHPVESWSLSDWMTALAGEVGEAANVIKKMNRARDGIINRKGETPSDLFDSLRSELADVFIYLILLAHRACIDLPKAVNHKFYQTSREIGYVEGEARATEAKTGSSDIADAMAYAAVAGKPINAATVGVDPGYSFKPERAEGGADIKTKHTNIAGNSATKAVPSDLLSALHDWYWEVGRPKMGKFESERFYRESKAFFEAED